MSSSLEGRVAVVFGVANKRSIAWSIAQGLHQAGATLVVTYQNERLELEARDLIASLPGAEGFMCDVSDDAAIDRLFAQLKERYGKLHVLVHSVAYAPAEELKGEFVATTREGFRVAHDVSVYSLVALARAAAPLMEDGGSIITMTYYGAERVVPRYNVMGVAKAALECSVRYLAYDLGKKKIRVNAISAGPIKTLAARGISGLGDMLKAHAERAPLQRNVDVNEVGATGVFLASDASSGITGEVIYVDCGYNIMGFSQVFAFPAENASFNLGIEFLQHIKAGIERKLDARALSHIGKIPLAFGIISHRQSRRRKTAQDFREIERLATGILPSHQNATRRVHKPVGEPAICKAIVAWILTQKRGIHAGDKESGAQAIRKTRAVSFGITLRTLAIIPGTIARLIYSGFGRHKENGVEIEILRG